MTSEIKLKCKTCKSYVTIDNPIIKKTKNDKFLLTGTCSVCKKPVKSFITSKYNNHLTDNDRETLKSGGMISALPILATLLVQKGIEQPTITEDVKAGGDLEKEKEYILKQDDEESRNGDYHLEDTSGNKIDNIVSFIIINNDEDKSLKIGDRLEFMGYNYKNVPLFQIVKEGNANISKEGGNISEQVQKAVDMETQLPKMINNLTLDNNEKRVLNLATSIASKHGLSMFIGNGLFLNEGNGLFGNGLFGNGLFGNGLFGNGLKNIKHKRVNLLKLKKIHNDIMEKVKLYKSKDKTGGVIDPISIIVEIILAIIGLISGIIGYIQNQQAEAREDAERERRDQEAKKADNDQKLFELKEMLKSYDQTLGELAEDADLPVKDFCLQQLQDATSKVSSMKRTILSKAKEFNKTPPEFVDYCMDIAGQYEWYNVNTLLQIMKDELTNPGYIKEQATPQNQGGKL
jgi:hypothetical protein